MLWWQNCKHCHYRDYYFLQPKKEVDPDKPKRPQSAYFLWLNENRARIKEEFPGISITELSKKAGEMWKEVTDKSVSITTLYNLLTAVEQQCPDDPGALWLCVNRRRIEIVLLTYLLTYQSSALLFTSQPFIRLLHLLRIFICSCRISPKLSWLSLILIVLNLNAFFFSIWQ